MDNGRIIRVLKLLTALQSGQCSVQDLVRLLGLSRRTLFRDLNVLRDAGIPILHDHATGLYSIEPGFFLPSVNLDQQEAFGVLLVLHKVAPHLNLPFQDAVRSATLKIQSSLPDPVRQSCQAKLQTSSIRDVATGSVKMSDTVFSLLQDAVATHSVVELQRTGRPDSAPPYTFCPVHLLQSRGQWYVIGRSPEDSQDELHTIRLNTVKSVHIKQKRFLADGPFHVGRHLGDAWGAQPEGTSYNVVLRFSSRVAEEVAAVQWHRTQRCQPRPDGSVIMDFRIDGLNEIMRWILAYGDQVQVLAPAALRDRVREIAAQTAAVNQKM